MKEDRNSPLGQEPDYTLPRSKILRGKKNFQRLFEKATTLRSDTVHFRYRIYDDSNEGCFVGFIVPKKTGNAVKRNQIKRLLREVYRINQHYISDLFAENNFGFHGAFLTNSPDVTYQDIENDMVTLLKKSRLKIQDYLEKRPATT
jgi:ribonuclease P protein component